MAFKIAGSMALKEAMQKAAPVLLEPIMRVEVTVPEDYMGDVIGDISSRRGRILFAPFARHSNSFPQPGNMAPARFRTGSLSC